MSKEKTVLTKEERDAIIDALLEEHCDDTWGEGCCEDVVDEDDAVSTNRCD